MLEWGEQLTYGVRVLSVPGRALDAKGLEYQPAHSQTPGTVNEP